MGKLNEYRYIKDFDSLRLTVKFDSVDEFDRIKRDMQAMVTLDEFANELAAKTSPEPAAEPEPQQRPTQPVQPQLEAALVDKYNDPVTYLKEAEGFEDCPVKQRCWGKRMPTGRGFINVYIGANLQYLMNMNVDGTKHDFNRNTFPPEFVQIYDNVLAIVAKGKQQPGGPQ